MAVRLEAGAANVPLIRAAKRVMAIESMVDYWQRGYSGLLRYKFSYERDREP